MWLTETITTMNGNLVVTRICFILFTTRTGRRDSRGPKHGGVTCFCLLSALFSQEKKQQQARLCLPWNYRWVTLNLEEQHRVRTCSDKAWPTCTRKSVRRSIGNLNLVFPDLLKDNPAFCSKIAPGHRTKTHISRELGSRSLSCQDMWQSAEGCLLVNSMAAGVWKFVLQPKIKSRLAFINVVTAPVHFMATTKK